MVKIQIPKIPDEGLKLDFLKEGDWLREAVPHGEDAGVTLQPVHASFLVRRTEKVVIIEGQVETVVNATCSRCLEGARVPVKTSFRYTFLPADEMVLQDRELSADDIEFSYFEGEVIDLDPLVYEQIVLQIPIKILCREDCRGLCLHCGTNRNVSRCDCEAPRGDERFAVLRNFKNLRK